jgi:hypothetical protein
LHKSWKALPAVLAWGLLLYQVAVFWLVPNFSTQDGPSHVYSGTVFWELVFHHRTAAYSPLYTAQHYPLPNWTGTILLAFIRAMAGVWNSERVFASLAFLVGFVAWCRAKGALDPGQTPWTPIANFLYQTWFLWLGFFDLYLGIALLPLAIALYVQKEGWLDRRRTAMLGITLLAIYFTHLIAAAAALVIVIALGLWMHIAVPAARRDGLRWRQFGLLLFAAAPSIVLMVLFAAGADARPKFEPRIVWAWQSFPMHVFLTAGHQQMQPLLWKALLVYAALGALLLRKREWASAKGGLVLAALLLFAVYLLVPDKGLGGSEAKIRFAWTVFIPAGLVAITASRLGWLRVPAAIFFGCFVCANTVATQRTAEAVSHAVKDYVDMAGQIAPGASLVRLRYPTPQIAAAYGFEGIGRDPLFHLEALLAAEKRALDLSDYEAISAAFPVVYKSSVDPGQLSGLWSFEGPDPDAPTTLHWIDENFPVPIDYVIVVGDTHSPEAARMGMSQTLGYLNGAMQLVAVSSNQAFRLYERRCALGGEPADRAAGRACAH